MPEKYFSVNHLYSTQKNSLMKNIIDTEPQNHNQIQK